MRKYRYYSRMLATYVAVVILYSILFASYFYIENNKNISADAKAQNQLNLMQIAKNADTRFSLANEMFVRICKEDSLIAYAAGDTENPLTAAGISEAIEKNVGDETGRGMNTYVTLLTSETDAVIGRDASVETTVADLMMSLGFGSRTLAEINDFYTQAEDNTGKCYAKFAERSAAGADRLVIVRRYMIDDEYPIYFVGDFSAEVLFGMNEQAGNALVIMDGDNIVCNIGPDAQATNRAVEDMQNEYGDISGIRGNAVEKSGFMFDVTHSSIFNWNYVLGASTAEMGMMTRSLIGSTVFITFMLTLLSILLILVLTRRLYKPIRKVLDVVRPYNQEQTGDEMEFITQTMSQIGNVNSELMEVVQSNKVPLKSKYFKDILFGLLNDEKLGEVIEQFSLGDIHPPLRVALLEFSSYEMLQDAFSKEAIFAIKEQINVFIGEQLRECMVHDALELDYKRFALIVNEPDLQTLRHLLMNVVMMVEGSFDVEITGAIGESSMSLAEVYESYNSAAAILENRFTVGSRNAVVTTEDISLATASSFYYPLDMERDIITHVIRLKREECHKILSNILAENIDKRSLGKDRRSAFIFALTATLNRIVESMNKSTDDVFGEGNIVFLELKMCSDGQELKSKVHQLFDKVIDFLDAENSQAEDDLSGQLLEYIHNNYNQDISLLDIGGHFNLSQCYISTLFKDITGENFKDYLSRYRIKRAKEILMEDPAVKNKDLAQMIGCNTVATLFRLFNKYEGISPGQYVKNITRS